MKKMKKLLAMLLAMVMVMGMSVTVFAEGETSVPATQIMQILNTQTPLADAYPTEADTTNITIAGVKSDANVVLYKIAEAEYYNGPQYGFKQYVYASPITTEDKDNELYFDPSNPTSAQITKIANALETGEITSYNLITGTPSFVAFGDDMLWQKKVDAGVYIAIITGSADAVYNPILLTATYNENGNLEGGSINTANALYGTEAVAKRSEPNVDKTITGGTEKETIVEVTENAAPKNSFTEDGKTKIHTATVGDVIGFAITPTMPSYPADAVNKTMIISDELPTGLTFNKTSLKIKMNEIEYAGVEIKTGETVTGYTFMKDDKTFATATFTENGFYISFVYDELLIENATDSEHYVYVPTVVYDVTVNEVSEAGSAGNTNEAKFIYANSPNAGETHDTPPTTPEEAEAWGVKTKEDEETVYTYQLAFLKTDDNEVETDRKPLAGAVFGIYTDQVCETLVDTVVTNENGYAVSTNVEAGTYYLKELVAPTGYQLSTEVTPITASWTSATKTVTTEKVQDRKYTTVQSENAEQMGWIKDGKFYEMSAWTEEDAKEAGARAAYEASGSSDTSSITLTTVTTIANNDATGSGTVYLGSITNTKLVALPSTGGIGTTIFTIGGCAIMILAAALYFASRRKAAK